MKHKITAALAFFIGVMSIVAGSKVILGFSTPDYTVLQWLVIYNVSIGVLSVAVAVLIWKEHPLMKGFSLLIIAIHSLVLVLLVTAFSEDVATESMKAMTFRIVIWFTIIILNFKQKKNEK